MPQILLPSFTEGDAHQRMDVEVVSKLPRMYRAIQDFDVVAMPSARVSYDMGEVVPVNTSGEFDIHYGWGGASPEYAGQGGNIVFSIDPDYDNRSKMTVAPQVMFVTAGYNEFEAKRYEGSLFDLIGNRMIGMNKGFTWAFNYELFASPRSSTELAAVTNGVLDIDAVVLANVGSGPWAQPGIKIKGYPASPLNRIHGFPFLIRPHVLGHTIHGRSSVNISHRSHVYIAQGVGATQPPQVPTGPPYIDTSVTDENLKDILIADKSGSGVFPIMSDIDYVIGNMQYGNRFTILGCTSSHGLSYLRRNLFNYTQAQVSEPLMDFGINYLNYVKHSGFNVVFYQDPMMDRLWPNSIIFWDPTMMPFGCVEGWSPKIREWVYLQQTLGSWAMAKVLWCQRFTLNPQASGWLLNCRWN